MPDPVPDPVADGPEPDEADEPQSGLGRGLAAIIPTLAGDLAATPARPRRQRRRGGVAAFLAPTPPGPADAGPEEDAAPPAADEVEGHEATPDPEAVAVAAAADEVAPGTAQQQLLLPDEESPPTPSAVRELRDDLVGALLDGLARTMALDVCGYLHQGPRESPHLFLRAPSLDAVGPTRAFELLDALRRALEEGRPRAALEVAGFHGLTVATSGVGSHGVWALGRATVMSPAEQEVTVRFCRSFGRAVHQLDGVGAPAVTPSTPVRVQAHRARDSVLAEVEVRVGDRIEPGHARADTGVEAVTHAVIAATGRAATFRYASEVAHEGEHAAVVLLEGPDHAVALGSARTREGGGVATALATVRALDGLAR